MKETREAIPCRGGQVFEPAAGRTALLVIDMQRDFLHPQGMCAILGEDITLLRAVMPRVAQLAAWARDRGLTIIHTREGYAPDLSDMPATKRARHAAAAVDQGPLGRFLIRGQAGQDFIDGMHPQGGEWIVDKLGFSAFHGTGLHADLQRAGITHLILCGVTTSCCVQSTLRAAVDLGYACLTVADCCAALQLDDHDRALDLIASEDHLFGQVCDLAALTGAAPRRDWPGTIRPMVEADGQAVMAIYAAGIATGHATFQNDPGTWEAFSTGKLAHPRLVAELPDASPDRRIAGFAVLSPTSARPIYRGICEVSIYIADHARGQGTGNALMSRLVADSVAAGIWTLTAGIFPENPASLLLHAAHGFRCLGRQRGAGQMPHGPMAGHWRDVLKLERRAER